MNKQVKFKCNFNLIKINKQACLSTRAFILIRFVYASMIANSLFRLNMNILYGCSDTRSIIEKLKHRSNNIVLLDPENYVPSDGVRTRG